MLKRFIIIIMILCHNHALADWIDPGVAYKCDASKGTFILAAVMQTSSPEDAGEIPVEDGFQILPYVKNSYDIKCVIGNYKVATFIERRPPTERGMCAAHNKFEILRLEVNAQTLLKFERFNNACFSSDLYRVELTAKRHEIIMKTCKGTWDWGKAYSDGSCEESTILPTNQSIKPEH